PRPNSATQSRTPEGPGAYVSVGLDSPKRVTDASLEVIRHSTPADVTRLMMPDALRGWLRNEAGQLDVAVIPLPPAGTAIPPPSVASSTTVVLFVPLNASRSDVAAMMSSLEKHGDKLLAVLAVHPSVVGRASRRAAAAATNVTARGVRRAQLG